MPSDPKRNLASSLTFWLLAGVLTYGAYVQGLFFTRDFLYAQAVIGIITLITVISPGKYRTWQVNVQDLLALSFLLSYLLGCLTAVNAKGAMTELFKSLTYFAAYWIIAHGGWNKDKFHRLMVIAFWGSFGVALLGIAAALGAVNLLGAYVDHRIYSTFQYPNTLAAYMGAMALLGAYLRCQARTRWGWLYIPGLFVVIVCLVATGSRGGLACFLLALPLLYIFLPKESRGRILQILLQNIILGFASALIFLKYLALGNLPAGWVIVLSGAVLSGILEGRLGLSSRLSLKTLCAVLLLGLVAVLTLYSASGGNPLQRLQQSSLQLHEFTERLTYYQDGLRMILARPVAGYGGGAWALYPRIQGYPYSVTDPHNNLVKIGLESGLLGVICYLGWWLGLGLQAWRQRKMGNTLAPLLFVCIAIFGLHSLMDFDLSYGFIGLLVWTCAGVITAHPDRNGHKDKFKVQKTWLIGLPVLLGVLLCSTAFSFLWAENDAAYGEVYMAEGRTSEALASFNSARIKDPFNAEYPEAQGSILLNTKQASDLEQAAMDINQALKLNSTDPSIKGLAANIYLAKGDLKQARSLAEDELSFNSFNPDGYLTLAQFYNSLAEKAQEQGSKAEARSYLLAGAQMANRLQTRFNQMGSRNIALWISGKPSVPADLQQICVELANKAQNIK